MREIIELMEPLKTKIKEEVTGLNKEVRSKVAGYIVAAFGLVAGLAWNDAVKAFIEHVFPMNGDTIVAKFVYAIIITLILVVVSVYVVRVLKGGEEEKPKG